MKKFINTALFALIIACTANNIFCTDAGLPTNEQVAQLMRTNKQKEDMMFMMAMLGNPEGWQLFKTRTALARLAYNNGQSGSDVKDLIGDVMPRRRDESLQERIIALRIKALESGLAENLNDLIVLEELEEVNPDNASTKRAFGVRS